MNRITTHFWENVYTTVRPTQSCPVCTLVYCGHSLANWDSCPSPAKNEAVEYLQVGPTEIRYSIAWTIFVYL